MVENGEVNLARIMVCVVDVKTIADRGGEQGKERRDAPENSRLRESVSAERHASWAGFYWGSL